MRRLSLLLALYAVAGGAYAQSDDFTGYIGVEGRAFWEEALSPDQYDANASLTGRAAYYRDFDENTQRLAVALTGRIDSEDSERTHADLGEFYWWRNFDDFELYLGVRKVFWGVTESVHLVDIVNQTNTLENIDGEDKLGQPMLSLVTAQDFGTISFFALPYFREREFPGETSRLRLPFPISDNARFQDDDEEQHLDLALRWSHYIDVWDFGLSHFSGTARAPVFEPEIASNGALQLRPYYAQIEQSGIDVQATIDAWLLKLEAISRYEKDFGRNSAAALGVEYTLFGIASSEADLGLVMEYQFDDRKDARQSIAQNDIVAGARYAFNDLDGSELLVLLSQDLDRDSRFFSLELSRRITDKWKVEAEIRAFHSSSNESPDFVLRRDDYLQLEFRRYF